MRWSDKEAGQTSTYLSTVDKRLWLSKAFYASFYVAIGALFPYLPVYFKQLKLSSHQNGILIGIRPLIQFCVTPLWGACADRFCKSKAIFLLSVLGWLVSNFSLSLVPVNDDPRLCDVYDTKNEDEISFEKTHTSLHKLMRNTSYPNIITHQRARKQNFYSRVSPYLDTTVPFIPITFRDFRDVCSITSPVRDKILGGLKDQDHWKDKPEVDIVKLQPSGQESSQDSTSEIMTSGKHVSCNSKEFLFLLLVTIIGTIISAPAQALADTVTLQSLNSETQNYGRVRLWGSLGWGIGGFSVGAAVSTNYHTNHCGEIVIDYGPCFYVYAAGMSVAFLCATQFQFDQETSDADNLKTKRITDGLKVFHSPQFCFVLFIAFFCGSATGFIETFLFWYLHELGGGQLLFSVINGLNCAAEVCVFFVTDKLLCFLGHINVIYLTLFCYFVRFIYFYFVESPWVVLPAELLQGITTAAFWSSCVSYVGLHPGASNTVQGILNGVYMGLGFATGGFLGGLLVHVAGMKISFLLYALASFCLLLIFVVINKINKK